MSASREPIPFISPRSGLRQPATRARADRPEIEALVIPGGNFPTMAFVPDWEREFGKPIITANQAALWAMLHVMKVDEKVRDLGRLLEQMPAI